MVDVSLLLVIEAFIFFTDELCRGGPVARLMGNLCVDVVSSFIYQRQLWSNEGNLFVIEILLHRVEAGTCLYSEGRWCSLSFF